jgi:hypothetical protein
MFELQTRLLKQLVRQIAVVAVAVLTTAHSLLRSMGAAMTTSSQIDRQWLMSHLHSCAKYYRWFYRPRHS